MMPIRRGTTRRYRRHQHHTIHVLPSRGTVKNGLGKNAPATIVNLACLG
jgi:hypothetical protein